MNAKIPEYVHKWNAAEALRSSGDFSRARTLFLEAATIAKQLSSEKDQEFHLNWAGRALRNAGDVCWRHLDNSTEAVALLREAEAIYRRTGIVIDEAACINNAADILNSLGQGNEALHEYLRAYSLIAELPYGRGHAIVLHNAASLSWDLGKQQEAYDLAKKGLRVASSGADPVRIDQFKELLTHFAASRKITEVAEEETTTFAASETVLEYQRSFANSHGPVIFELCNAARSICHQSHYGLNEAEILKVKGVPILSFPMHCINACVSSISGQQCYVNISPELLITIWRISHLFGDYLVGDLQDSVFTSLLTIITSLADTKTSFEEAYRLKEQYNGRTIYQQATMWIALHEYGHYLLGHLATSDLTKFNVPFEGDPKISVYQTVQHRMEFEADEFATIRSLRAHDEQENLASAFMFSVGLTFSVLRAASAFWAGYNDSDDDCKSSSTHPDFFERLLAVKATLERERPNSRSAIDKAFRIWRNIGFSEDSISLWRHSGERLKRTNANAAFPVAGTV